MPRARPFAALCACAVAGCLDGVPLDLPPPPAAGTEILLRGLDADDGPRALVRTEASPPVSLPDGPALVLQYDFPPEELFLPVGAPLRSPHPDAPRQALPLPVARFEITPEGWSPVPPEPVAVEDFAIPRVTFERCHEAGRCLSLDPAARCPQTCDPTPVATPAPPQRPCPTGWSPDLAETGPPICRPEWQDSLPCPPGTRQGFDDAACIANSICPGRTWAAPRPDATAELHVRLGSVGGDGSAPRPFGTLAAALAAAPPGADILLAAGEYEGGAIVEVPGLRIAGPCATEARWLGDGVVVSARAADLIVEGASIESRTSTAIEVHPSGSLTVVGCDVRALGFGIGARGPLTVFDTTVRAATGISVRATTAALERVDLEGEPAVWLRGSRAVAADDARLRGGLDAADVDSVRLTEVAVEGGAHGISALQVATFFATDVSVRGAEQTGVRVESSPERGAPAQAELTRLSVSGSGRDGILGYGVHVTATDVHVDAPDQTQGILLTPQGHVDPPVHMRFEGLWLRVVDDPGLALTRDRNQVPALDVSVDDLVLRGAPGPFDSNPGIGAGRDMSLRIRRGYIETFGDSGIEVACGHVVLEDVDIVAHAPVGMFLEAAVFGEPLDPGSISRLRVTGGTQSGLLINVSDSCPPTPVPTRDLQVVGCPECQVGVSLQPEREFEVERLAIRGFAVGLEAGELARPRVRGGAIEDNRVGVRAPPSVDLTDGLRRVRLRNDRDLERF